MGNNDVLRAMRAAFSMTQQRCYNPKCKDYPYYGGRGIEVDPRWRGNFEALLRDMGPREEGMTLERKDNNGPYSPENCVWATRKDQGVNRRIVKRFVYQGKAYTIAEIADLAGVSYATMKARLNRLGYTPEQAVCKEVKCGGLVEGKVYPKRAPPDMSKVKRGLDHPGTALTLSQVRKARRLHSQGWTFTAVGKHFKISIETASQAVQGHGAYKGVK